MITLPNEGQLWPASVTKGVCNEKWSLCPTKVSCDPRQWRKVSVTRNDHFALVGLVFHGSRLVFHGFSWFQVGFSWFSPKCTCLNCILARQSSLGPPPVGQHRTYLRKIPNIGAQTALRPNEPISACHKEVGAELTALNSKTFHLFMKTEYLVYRSVSCCKLCNFVSWYTIKVVSLVTAELCVAHWVTMCDNLRLIIETSALHL